MEIIIDFEMCTFLNSTLVNFSSIEFLRKIVKIKTGRIIKTIAFVLNAIANTIPLKTNNVYPTFSFFLNEYNNKKNESIIKK